MLNPDGSIRMENYTESTTRNVTDADGNVVMEEYTEEVTRQVEIGGVLQLIMHQMLLLGTVRET